MDETTAPGPDGEAAPEKKTGWEALSKFVADGSDQAKDVYDEAKSASGGVYDEAKSASEGVLDEARESSRGVAGEAAASAKETRRTGWATLKRWFGGGGSSGA